MGKSDSVIIGIVRSYASLVAESVIDGSSRDKKFVKDAVKEELDMLLDSSGSPSRYWKVLKAAKETKVLSHKEYLGYANVYM